MSAADLERLNDTIQYAQSDFVHWGETLLKSHPDQFKAIEHAWVRVYELFARQYQINRIVQDVIGLHPGHALPNTTRFLPPSTAARTMFW